MRIPRRIGRLPAAALALALVPLTGCTFVGAGLGAALGAAASPHHPGRGAAIGAVAGAVIGSEIDRAEVEVEVEEPVVEVVETRRVYAPAPCADVVEVHHYHHTPPRVYRVIAR
ncbi:MAG: glycine zipper 2TM domain-containing protein [Planctomycetota bacterium]|nr:MAG: glycine zipper 2TM domain-containing protein [Planctomycetota bacterium]